MQFYCKICLSYEKYYSSLKLPFKIVEILTKIEIRNAARTKIYCGRKVKELRLRSKKAGRFETLLGFARSHFIVTRGSMSLSRATTLQPSCFSNLNGSIFFSLLSENRTFYLHFSKILKWAKRLTKWSVINQVAQFRQILVLRIPHSPLRPLGVKIPLKLEKIEIF